MYVCVYTCTCVTENGMLASRVEILTRYHMESMKKMGQSLVDVVSSGWMWYPVGECGL